MARLVGHLLLCLGLLDLSMVLSGSLDVHLVLHLNRDLDIAQIRARCASRVIKLLVILLYRLPPV